MFVQSVTKFSCLLVYSVLQYQLRPQIKIHKIVHCTHPYIRNPSVSSQLFVLFKLLSRVDFLFACVCSAKQIIYCAAHGCETRSITFKLYRPKNLPLSGTIMIQQISQHCGWVSKHHSNGQYYIHANRTGGNENKHDFFLLFSFHFVCSLNEVMTSNLFGNGSKKQMNSSNKQLYFACLLIFTVNNSILCSAKHTF